MIETCNALGIDAYGRYGSNINFVTGFVRIDPHIKIQDSRYAWSLD